MGYIDDKFALNGALDINGYFYFKIKYNYFIFNKYN